MAVPWFGLGPFLRPGLHDAETSRAAPVKGAQRRPQGALDGCEHGVTLDYAGPLQGGGISPSGHDHSARTIGRCPMVETPPGLAGEA